MPVSPVSGPPQARISLAPTATVATVPKVDLTPIPKADIKLDVEKIKAQLKQAIEKMNEVARDGGRGLSFHMDSAVGGPVVVVKNSTTGEVIRQIPNAEAVKTAHDIERFRSIFVNKLV